MLAGYEQGGRGFLGGGFYGALEVVGAAVDGDDAALARVDVVEEHFLVGFLLGYFHEPREEEGDGFDVLSVL